MLVLTVAVLLAWLMSGWLPSTEAVLVITPAVVGVTVTVIVSVAPAARLGIVSGSVLPAWGIVPPLPSLSETNVALAGRASVITTPVAVLVALLFLTMI